MATIREMIKERSERLRDISNIPPHEAAEILVQLTSLLSTLNAYIVDKQFTYNQKRVEIRAEKKSVAEAKLFSESTIEWREWQEAVAQRDALEEAIRALKYYIRGLENERNLV